MGCRSNLDPWGDHRDAALVAALQAVHLWEPLCRAGGVEAARSRPQGPGTGSGSAAVQADQSDGLEVGGREKNVKPGHRRGQSQDSQGVKAGVSSAMASVVLGLRLQGTCASGAGGGGSEGGGDVGRGGAAREESGDSGDNSADNSSPLPRGGEAGGGEADVEQPAVGPAVLRGPGAGGGVRRTVGLSAGQQQLLCLARLLLSGRRVVLLDEVTACIDAHTAETVHEVRGGGGAASIAVVAGLHQGDAVRDRVVFACRC